MTLGFRNERFLKTKYVPDLFFLKIYSGNKWAQGWVPDSAGKSEGIEEWTNAFY